MHKPSFINRKTIDSILLCLQTGAFSSFILAIQHQQGQLLYHATVFSFVCTTLSFILFFYKFQEEFTRDAKIVAGSNYLSATSIIQKDDRERFYYFIPFFISTGIIIAILFFPLQTLTMLFFKSKL